MGAQVPRDSHVSAPPSHPLGIPGHMPHPGLPAAESSSQLYKGCNSLTSESLPQPPPQLDGGGQRGVGGRLRAEPTGGPRRVPGGVVVPGKEEAAWAKGVGEQRVTLAWLMPKGPWADSRRAVLTGEHRPGVRGMGAGWWGSGWTDGAM